jgi:hypothetical protein
MVRKRVIIRILLSFVIVYCVLGAVIFWMIDPLNFRAPKDQKLVSLFYEHRTAFEKLREMATEDLNQTSFISESAVKGKISETRKLEYKKLISGIFPSMILAADYDASVRFVFADGGLSAISPGWVKGIEYVPGDIRRKGGLVQSLDMANNLPAGVYLRLIESNWFIVYQRTDD